MPSSFKNRLDGRKNEIVQNATAVLLSRFNLISIVLSLHELGQYYLHSLVHVGGSLVKVKGTRCLGSVELVFENRLYSFVIKCIWEERYCKSGKQWSTQTCLEIARLSFYLVDYGWPFMDKWPTVLVCKVKGKPSNFEANLCGSLYSTFKISFEPMHFITNGYKRFYRPTPPIQGNVFL